ncbi:hypothetical protein [Altericista sp. CCNU0014]|uniref:glycosyltransferase family 39 protein n=1 Tax=Altericista sp. CCNU0014 TaxID=3082949 RepID=UPI00384B1244
MLKTRSKTLHTLAQKSQNGLTLVLLLALALGIFFRFAHLDRQVYWHDETFTSLRISGYSAIEVNRELFDGKVVGVEALQKYQQVNPDKTAIDTVRSLAIDDSQHPPLYYLWVRQWSVWFGPSVVAVRSLSAAIGLLVFPSAYWLCQELFAGGTATSPAQKQIANLTSGMAIALFALSPFHVLYAQEAREYSLWTVLILLSGAAFLRAIRLNTPAGWGLFTGLLILSLYTQPIMLFVAIAFGLYLLVVERFRINRVVLSGLVSLALGVVAFLPWLQIIAKSWSVTGATWTSVPIPLPILLKTWGLHLLRAFILTEGDFGFDHWTTYIALPLSIGLVGAAFYALYRQTPLRVWLFAIALAGSVFVPLGLMDLVLGGQRSVSGRYIVPFYVGVPIAVAYLLSQKLLSQKSRVDRAPTFLSQKLWPGIAAAVLSVSLIYCIVNTQATTAWTKGINYNLPILAKLINAAPQPLLVSNSFGIDYGSTFALARQLEPKVKLQLVDAVTQPDDRNLPKIAPGFSDVFLLNPSDAFRQKLERQQQQKTKLVFHDFHLVLWKLVPW